MRPLALALVLAPALALTAGSAAEGAPADAQARELDRLMAEFRAEPSAAATERITDRVIEIGGGAPRRLLEAALAESRPLLDRYVTAYAAEGPDVGRRKLQAHLAEAQPLRAELRAMRQYLSKDRLAREAWPIVTKLDRLLAGRPEDVVAASRTVGRLRERLEAIDQCRRRLRAALEPKTKRKHPKGFPAGWAARGRRERGLLDLVADVERQAALMGLAANDRDEMVLRENAAVEGLLTARERAGMREANRVRLLLGLPSFYLDVKLCEAARDHAQDMARLNFVSHQSPVAGKAMPWDRARRFGTTCKSENVSYGGTSPAWIIQRWFVSPGHHVNLLNPAYYRAGVGNHGQLWVMMYGK